MVHKWCSFRRCLRLDTEGQAPSSDPWDTFFELDWVRARHPTTNTYLPAKIITKDRKAVLVYSLEALT